MSSHEFVDALIDHYPRFIRFPETEAESQEHINNFAERSDFPQIVGAIDHTHIEIKRPDEDYDDYMNCKVTTVYYFKELLMQIVSLWMSRLDMLEACMTLGCYLFQVSSTKLKMGMCLMRC